MIPVTREEIYLSKLAGGSVTVPTPISRKEMYLAKACGESVTVPDPVSREEMYLYKLAGGSITLPVPVSRLELLMAAACGEAVVPYDPVSRLEWFWSQLVSPTQTITGMPPLTFTSDGTALSGWIIYGNGQQTGTPSPQSIIMPTFCGVRAANLFDSIYTSAVIGGSGGNVYSTNSAGKTAIIPCNPNTEYTVKKHDSSNRFTIAESNSIPQNQDTVAIIYNNDSANEYTFTTSAISKYLLVYVSTSTQQAEPRLMVNSGSTALPYEPYGYKIPITCAGQTVPVYLGQTQTVRRVGKVRLGDLTWSETTVSDVVCFISIEQINRQYAAGSNTLLCDRYKPVDTRYSVATENNTIAPYNNTNSNRLIVHDSRYETAAAWIAANADTYLWYILDEPTTGIVNEPLAKIGDYADELHSENAGVTIPTVSGSNTLTIGTTLQPSSVSITGHISQ